MPLCHSCRTVYLHASFAGPAEPCDCGGCVTAEEMRQLRNERVDSGSSDDPREAIAESEAR